MMPFNYKVNVFNYKFSVLYNIMKNNFVYNVDYIIEHNSAWNNNEDYLRMLLFYASDIYFKNEEDAMYFTLLCST